MGQLASPTTRLHSCFVGSKGRRGNPRRRLLDRIRRITPVRRRRPPNGKQRCRRFDMHRQSAVTTFPTSAAPPPALLMELRLVIGERRDDIVYSKTGWGPNRLERQSIRAAHDCLGMPSSSEKIDTSLLSTCVPSPRLGSNGPCIHRLCNARPQQRHVNRKGGLSFSTERTEIGWRNISAVWRTMVRPRPSQS